MVEAVRGHQISQARVIAHVGDREILTVVGALGQRPEPARRSVGDPTRRPAARRLPAAAADEPPRGHDHGSLRVEARRRAARTGSSPGSPGSGNASLWVRLPELIDASAAALAIIGDFVPFGIGQALGLRAGGNSLDNTLRVAHRVPTEWVLADVRVHAIADGFGHGLVHLWAEDGTLLGTASQSTIVRVARPARRGAGRRAGR